MGLTLQSFNPLQDRSLYSIYFWGWKELLFITLIMCMLYINSHARNKVIFGLVIYNIFHKTLFLHEYIYFLLCTGLFHNILDYEMLFHSLGSSLGNTY